MTEYECVRCGQFLGDDIFSGRTGTEPRAHICRYEHGQCGYCGGPLPSCGCNGFGRWPGKEEAAARIRSAAADALRDYEKQSPRGAKGDRKMEKIASEQCQCPACFGNGWVALDNGRQFKECPCQGESKSAIITSGLEMAAILISRSAGSREMTNAEAAAFSAVILARDTERCPACRAALLLE